MLDRLCQCLYISTMCLRVRVHMHTHSYFIGVSCFRIYNVWSYNPVLWYAVCALYICVYVIMYVCVCVFNCYVYGKNYFHFAFQVAVQRISCK